MPARNAGGAHLAPVPCSIRRHSRHDVFMSESEARAAFMTAALVLLVMPIVYVIGLAGTILLLQITPWGDMREVMFGVAIIWGVVVMSGVLVAARRLNRPSARP
jgi:hypothetical protein